MHIDQKIVEVLREAYPVLELLQDDFFVIGSAALILSGVEIGETEDIDILMTDRDAAFIAEEWEERHRVDHCTQRDDLFHSRFSRYYFERLDVEVMGALQVQKNGMWIPLVVKEHITLSLQGMQIKIPTLKEQMRILETFGRTKDLEKVKRIETYIRENRISK